MEHTTLRGRLDYIADGVGVTGREWFTLTVHSDGRRTMRALTALDDRMKSSPSTLASPVHRSPTAAPGR